MSTIAQLPRSVNTDGQRGGLERTAGEYANLFAPAGFRLTRTVATGTDWVVIEAVPAGAADLN